MPRRAAKVDGNHGFIRDSLRDLGFDVDDIHTVGYGMPDLIVTGQPHWAPCAVSLKVEIKMPGGRLTKMETEYVQALRHRSAYLIAYGFFDVLEWFYGND